MGRGSQGGVTRSLTERETRNEAWCPACSSPNPGKGECESDAHASADANADADVIQRNSDCRTDSGADEKAE